MTASSLCVFLYLLVLATLASEQKAKGEHFYTLDLLAFSFMSLEGGGQEMSVRVCVHVSIHARVCVRVCVVQLLSQPLFPHLAWGQKKLFFHAHTR